MGEVLMGEVLMGEVLMGEVLAHRTQNVQSRLCGNGMHDEPSLGLVPTRLCAVASNCVAGGRWSSGLNE